MHDSLLLAIIIISFLFLFHLSFCLLLGDCQDPSRSLYRQVETFQKHEHVLEQLLELQLDSAD